MLESAITHAIASYYTCYSQLLHML